jgi:hypothetical protein
MSLPRNSWWSPTSKSPPLPALGIFHGDPARPVSILQTHFFLG